MKTPQEIQQLIQDKRNELFRRRPSWAVYEFVGFLDTLQKLNLITLEEAYHHSIEFAGEF